MNQDLENLALMIDGTPEIQMLTRKRMALNGSSGAISGQLRPVSSRRLRADRWCIAAAAAQARVLSALPFCDDDGIEVGSTSIIEEGAIRWRISLVLMCR